MLNLSTETQTVCVLVGALFLLIGLLGGGLEISAIKVPSAGTPQRFVLGLVGALLVAVGAANMLGGDSSSPPPVASSTTAGTATTDPGTTGTPTSDPAPPPAGPNDPAAPATGSGTSGGDGTGAATATDK